MFKSFNVSSVAATTTGECYNPGAQVACKILPDFDRSTSSLGTEVETMESSSTGSMSDSLSAEERVSKFSSWLVNDAERSLAYCKSDEEEVCSVDESPSTLDPDDDGEEPRKTTEHRKRQRYCLLGTVVLLFVFVAGAVGSWFFLDSKRRAASSSQTNATATRSFPDCDISGIERICRPFYDSDEAILEEKDIPKCVRENFSVAFVKSGNPKDYTVHADRSLLSCGSSGMALKRLSKLEYERHTAGMLGCEYTVYRLFYEFREIEWWTEDGAMITSVCTRNGVQCNGAWEVESFEPDYWGGSCIVSELSILSGGSA